MLKSLLYLAENLLGEVELYPVNQIPYTLGKEIRISQLSISSERCSPLSVLHTIAPLGVSFKMESKLHTGDISGLGSLHSTCLRENKTAIVKLGEEEVHLVAMPSRKNTELYSCFWCFVVSVGLYDSCLIMLNLRCLGIVFDLDETLVVANTMRSFEDRIDALQRKVSTEMDPQRIDGMLAEIKRYHDDRAILKQYVDNDQIVEDGLIFKIQPEVVPAFSDNHPPIVRPLIRLPDKNIVLTRINPAIRDTSVLVRLRPAWEELRNYLTARGRKRFEVFVCTMAEKDYALEMWRLLDPGLNLINSKELLDRIVCVKAGSRKSLLTVFHDGICHPKMALVIDDRLKVWDEKDQPRVHVVPPFVPYYAPQAEVSNTVPVLCVARNVACNVRGSFFKEFDENLLQRLSDIFYEDDVPDLSSPDVGNYMISEDDASFVNKDPLYLEGAPNVEVERRLKDAVPAPADVNNFETPLQLAVATSSNPLSQPPSPEPLPFDGQQLHQVASPMKPSQPSLQASPGREEGELPESEVDLDTRRRLLIWQHGQDKRVGMSRDPPFPVRLPAEASPPPVRSQRSWSPLEEEMSSREVNQAVPKTLHRKVASESDSLHFDKHRPSRASYFHGMEGPVTSGRSRRKFPREARRGDRRLQLKDSPPDYSSLPGEGFSSDYVVRTSKASYIEDEEGLYSGNQLGVLQDIAKKCGTRLEFQSALVSATELQFSVEVWLAGEKVGEGSGETRKKALHQAVQCSIMALSSKYMSTVLPDPSSECEKLNKLSQKNESDVLGDPNPFGRGSSLKEVASPISTASESSRYLNPRLEGFKRPLDSVSALKQICFKEGLALMIKSATDSTDKEEEQAQVEIGGEVLGQGTGSTWEEAKIQAAEEALGNLESMLCTKEHPSSPRSVQGTPSKRLRPDSSQILSQLPSSARYS